MVDDDTTPVRAVTAGQCTDCGTDSDNYTVTDRTFHDPSNRAEEDEPTGVTRELVCDCGAQATVTISESGLSTEGAISHADAPWNDES